MATTMKDTQPILIAEELTEITGTMWSWSVNEYGMDRFEREGCGDWGNVVLHYRLPNDWETNRRAEISVWPTDDMNESRPYDLKRPDSITVKSDRSAKAIAGEIARRLLPDAITFWEANVKGVEGDALSLKTTRELAESIGTALGDLYNHTYPVDARMVGKTKAARDVARGDIGRYNRPGVRGEFNTHQNDRQGNPYGTVEFKVDIPTEHAARFAEMIREIDRLSRIS